MQRLWAVQEQKMLEEEENRRRVGYEGATTENYGLTKQKFCFNF
jgi:hypothetical protein